MFDPVNEVWLAENSPWRFALGLCLFSAAFFLVIIGVIWAFFAGLDQVFHFIGQVMIWEGPYSDFNKAADQIVKAFRRSI